MSLSTKAKVYTRYPFSSILIYNGTTVLYFLLDNMGMILGYDSWPGYLMASMYLVFSFVEMYVLMPLKVCPGCTYYRLDNSLCISGLNVVSRKVATEGNAKDFPRRAKGVFCPNNLYMAALAIPIIALIPALMLHFSFVLLGVLLVMAGPEPFGTGDNAARYRSERHLRGWTRP